MWDFPSYIYMGQGPGKVCGENAKSFPPPLRGQVPEGGASPAFGTHSKTPSTRSFNRSGEYLSSPHGQVFLRSCASPAPTRVPHHHWALVRLSAQQHLFSWATCVLSAQHLPHISSHRASESRNIVSTPELISCVYLRAYSLLSELTHHASIRASTLYSELTHACSHITYLLF